MLGNHKRILGNHTKERQTALGGVWGRKHTQLMWNLRNGGYYSGNVSEKKMPMGKLELYELEVLRAGQEYLE